MFNIKDGFDIVLGNPPYVQLEKDGGRLGRLYETYNFESFARRGDIYCLFYEKAIQLLTQDGHLCFITSNKWMHAAYGRNLRDHFIKHTQPIQLLDMGPGVFDATVDTNIMLLRSVKLEVAGTTFHAVILRADFDKQAGNIAQYLNDNGVPMELPAKGEPWAILSPKEVTLKRKIEHIGKPLKDWNVSINYGIKTGCNEAFVIDESKRDELVARAPKSAEIIKPLLRGRDIHRYLVRWDGLWVIAAKFGSHKYLAVDFPAVFQHLLQYQEKLKARGQCRYSRSRRVDSHNGYPGQHHWLELDNNPGEEYLKLFSREKIVYPNMTKFLPFVYDQDGYYTNDKAFIITGGKYLKYLTGYFNSKVAAKWIRENCPELQGGTRELRKAFFENISVPPVTEANQHLVAKIEGRVDGILAAKRTNLGEDTSALENEIDEIVYSLYDLTDKEIAIVEENTV